MSVFTTLVYFFIALVSGLVFLIKYRYSFWKRRGIQHAKPQFPVGNMKGFMRTRHLRDIMTDHYDKFKNTGPFAGFYFFLTPAVLVFDLNLIKDILIKDFHNFTDRGLFHNERDDPLTGNLFCLDGPKWKQLRNKLSPTFTSGKMKYMFPTVMSVGEELRNTLGDMIEVDSIVELKDILARFTIDVIGTCAFGIDCNSLKGMNAEFRTMGGKIFTLHRHSKLFTGFVFSFPKLARKLRIRIVHEDIHQFFTRVVRETINSREQNCIKRKDFLDLLLQLKNSEDGITINEITAQAFIFFLAGFETSSTTMGFVLFELAVNQDVQDKLRAEINEQLEKHDGKFTYECMADMHYMEMVIKETLRKYSVVINIMRISLNEYPTSDPKYTIPKGALVLIPVDAIHRDPEIYPNPEQFDPERFSEEEIQKRHSTSWLPFGDGPRNCIGLRFGKMQMYIGLAILLRNYKFHYSERTPNPLEFDATNSVPAVKGGIYLRVERI